MVAELNEKILAELKNINLHLDGFNIPFDYDFFSNKSIVTMSHGVLIKLEGLDLSMRLGFKDNEILCRYYLLYLRLWLKWKDIQRYMST